MPPPRPALLPVILLALCACHQDDAAIVIPVADGFQPVFISVEIGNELVSLSFLSPERAQLSVATVAGGLLTDDEPVVRTVALKPDAYRAARSGIIALLSANGIRAAQIHGPGSRLMTISIGGMTGQLAMNINRDLKDNLPDGYAALRSLVESYLHAPDIDQGKGR